MAKAVLIIDQFHSRQHLISFIDEIGRKLMSEEQHIASAILGSNPRYPGGKFLLNTDHGQLEIKISREPNLP